MSWLTVGATRWPTTVPSISTWMPETAPFTDVPIRFAEASLISALIPPPVPLQSSAGMPLWVLFHSSCCSLYHS